MEAPVMNCRFFSGYKPCGKNQVCNSQCPQKDIPQERILIIHLEALGAVLRATSILPAIKRKWPKSHITWITSPRAFELLENNPLIDRILKNDHNGVLSLSNLEFDFTFCIDKSMAASGLINQIKAAGEKRGFGIHSKTGAIVPLNPEAGELYNLGIDNYSKFFVNKKPETQLITESLGLDWQRDAYVFNFTKEELQIRDTLKRSLNLKTNRPIIGLNTGCSPTIPYKKLTIEGWTKVIRQIKSQFPKSQILLLGGPEDEERNNQIGLSTGVLSTPTDQGIRNGALYVDLCDAVLTGDSLGMHIAIALKKWVVCWFGPTCAHEIDFYDKGISILSKAPCAPCWKRQCSQPVMCYDLVDFNQLVQALSPGLKSAGLIEARHAEVLDLA